MTRDASDDDPEDLRFLARTLRSLAVLSLASTAYLAVSGWALDSILVAKLTGLAGMVTIAATVTAQMVVRSPRVATIVVSSVTGTTALLAAWLTPDLAPAASFGGLAVLTFSLAIHADDVRRVVQAAGAATTVGGVALSIPEGATISAWVWLPSTLATMAISIITIIGVRGLIQQRHLARLDAEADAAAERARAEATEAWMKERATFYAGLHHELRAPLQSMLFSARSLPAPHTDRLRSSAQHLSSLLDDLMDVARIDAGAWAVRSERFDPRTAIMEAIEIVAGHATSQGTEVSVRLDDLPVACRGDARRLRQVVINLVGNAVRHTPDGHVQVSASGGRTLRIRIDDDGPGFQDEDALHPFQQGRRPGVNGLGLSVVDRIAHTIGGSITLGRSEAGGASVEVLWPVENEVAEVRARDDLSGLEVLVCDDDPLLLGLTVEVLQDAGARCTTATGLRSACEAVRARPHVLLMDLHLPDGDGRDVMANAREAGVPVVFLTGAPEPSEVQALLDMGAWGVVEKPCEPEQLVDIVASAAMAPQLAD